MPIIGFTIDTTDKHRSKSYFIS